MAKIIPANPGFNVVVWYATTEEPTIEPVTAWQVSEEHEEVRAFTPAASYDLDKACVPGMGEVVGLQYPDGRVYIGNEAFGVFAGIEEAGEFARRRLAGEAAD